MSAVLASKHQGKGVKMPTIKDIARIAGVSHGTVSNVLNGRGNVSVEKIEAVQRAAREVGYQLNAQAQSLRASKSQGVALILPDINAERYYQLYRGLHQAWQPSLSEPVDLYLTNGYFANTGGKVLPGCCHRELPGQQPALLRYAQALPGECAFCVSPASRCSLLF